MGHGSKCRDCGVVARSAESGEAADDERKIVESRCRMLLEEAACPSGARPSVTTCIVLRDQRDELERLPERHLADLPRGRLSDERFNAGSSRGCSFWRSCLNGLSECVGCFVMRCK